MALCSSITHDWLYNQIQMSKRLTLISELKQQIDDPATRKQPNKASGDNVIGAMITLYEAQTFIRLLESMSDEDYLNLTT